MRGPDWDESRLFMSFEEGLKVAFWSGMDFDDAIKVLRDKIAFLERCRDNGLDPKKY